MPADGVAIREWQRRDLPLCFRVSPRAERNFLLANTFESLIDNRRRASYLSSSERAASSREVQVARRMEGEVRLARESAK